MVEHSVKYCSTVEPFLLLLLLLLVEVRQQIFKKLSDLKILSYVTRIVPILILRHRIHKCLFYQIDDRLKVPILTRVMKRSILIKVSSILVCSCLT